MAGNLYIKDALVVPEAVLDSGIRCAFVFGRALYDPAALCVPHCIGRDQIGTHRELVIRVAGATYYPTSTGYVAIRGG